MTRKYFIQRHEPAATYPGAVWYAMNRGTLYGNVSVCVPRKDKKDELYWHKIEEISLDEFMGKYIDTKPERA